MLQHRLQLPLENFMEGLCHLSRTELRVLLVQLDKLIFTRDEKLHFLKNLVKYLDVLIVNGLM